MRDFLLFTLAAPLASFGGLAGHERRGTGNRPGRSAVLGQLGAALGVDRRDPEGQAALATGYGVAVRTLSAGHPVRDYHTIQTVPRGRARGAATRAQAMSAAGRGLETTITVRDYRADVAFTVAVWARDGARWPLSALAAALHRPVFVLWLGRKGCPPAAPLAPRFVAAADAAAALTADSISAEQPGLSGARWRAIGGEIAGDLDGLPDPLPAGARLEEAWDQPGSRQTWQFRPRPVAILPAPEGAE